MARSEAGHPLDFDPFSASSQAWATDTGPALVEENIDWQRKLRGLWRYRWLILATTMLGVGAGVAAYKLYPEEYVARGAVWVQQTNSEERATGPIRSGGLLRQEEWIDLLESYAVLDPVVISQGLRVVPHKPEHKEFVSGIVLNDMYTQGFYRLKVDGSKSSVELWKDNERIERAEEGKAIGTSAGFLWVPDLSLVNAGEDIVFSLATVRDAADNLNRELQAFMNRGSFIELELAGRDPVAQASIVNGVMDQFVLVANELKTGQLNERVKILGEQLTRTGAELTESERRLEDFRVQTIMLPSERGVVVTPGLQATRDPAFTSFFNLKERVNDLQYDRAKLVEALDAIPTQGVRIEAFEAVASVSESTQLTAALSELGQKRQELRDLRLRYTDEHPPVARLIVAIDILENETIPTVTRLLNAEMAREEENLTSQLEASATELAQIPPRSIEEARLGRNVTIVGTLYTELRQRYEQAALEAASSIPDVRVLDRSVPPDVPNDDQRNILALLLAMGGLGIGIAAGLILERMDPRLRDVRDVTSDLGFTVLGAIPNAPAGKSQKAQIGRNSVVEAFRALRLNTSYAFGNSGPILVSVTSPAPQEGKTTVSVNLALAFSELGKRTLLVDADTRRGDLHEPFQLVRNPGLVTYLSEEATRDEVVRQVRDNLDVVTSGERSSKSPELLSSSRMMDLIADAKGKYDVIIIDSPPIGAGSDAFVLGTMCGSSILVLRSGVTDLGYAEVMTEPLRRLPVRLLGVVMNDIKPGSGSGPTRHYANYLPDYGATDELVQIG